jgi:hypothetical protein
MYCIKEGEIPFSKWRSEFLVNGRKEAVELLGSGQQTVVEGIHPSGEPYKWRNGHPCERGTSGLSEMTRERFEAVCGEIRSYLDRMGFQVISDTGTSSSSERGKREACADASHLQKQAPKHRSLDDPWGWAPKPGLVLEALKERPNTAENVPSYSDFIRELAAIKYALGPNRQDYYGKVEEWALAYDGNTPEFVREKWESIRDSALGWDYLASKVPLVAAQHDFADDLPQEWLPGASPANPAVAPESKRVQLTPFVLRDPKTIPPRKWLYDHHYIKGYLSATVSTGGLGKSGLVIVEALAMVTGRNLLAVEPTAKLRVLYVNAEDPMEELERRIAAARIYYNIPNEQICDRLFVISGRDTEIVFARDDGRSLKVNDQVIVNLREEIIRNEIDVVILDPFVALHGVSENDNNKINEVCKILRTLAEETGCAIEVVHHVRKSVNGQTETSVEDARGASALINAVRSARTLNKMSKDEASLAGIDEDKRGYYFRVDNGKANLAPPAEKSTWRRHVSVQLGNGKEIPHVGDDVGVPTSWEWPDPSEGVTADEVRAVQEAVAGGEWRADVRADRWVGRAIADTFGFELTKAGKAKAGAP